MNSSLVACAVRTIAERAHSARYVPIRIRRMPQASLAVLSLCGALLCPASAPAADRFAGMRQDVGAGWRGADQALARGTTAAGSPLLTIRQTQSRAILNWKQFDIDAGETVYFDQQGNSGWAALNRIGGSDPSRIAGALKADGQVYLINRNGILFAKGAQVDVHSLVASSLDISDDTFNAGIASLLPGAAAFAGSGGFVEVAAGAELKAQSGGQIMLLAPDVKNSGAISTPNGQTILAAGEKIYLSLPSDDTPGLRGFLVEVDNGGSAQNLNLGSIIAERGNVTLAGLAVNQSGLVRATTSVTLNGSIKLLAKERSGVLADGSAVNGRTGSVVLGQGSTTEAIVDGSDTQTTQDKDAFVAPNVEIAGKSIKLEANSTVRATGGTVTLSAAPDLGVTDATGVRIYLDAGSRIDVAGTQDVAVAMERNVVAVDLIGSVLADNPLARNGALKGKKVYVDVRKGTPFADVSGYTAQIERTVGERTAAGGTVNLTSGGDIVLRQGSALDVSGGSLRYRDGYIKTTKLVSDGRIYDIGDASPNRVYQGTADEYSVSNYKWGVTQTYRSRGRGIFTPGYLEGKDAGTVNLLARGLVLDGALIGTTTPGQWQREGGKLPQGGQLIVGNASGGGVADYQTPSIVFAAQKHLLPEDFSFAAAQLPQDFTQATTFSTEFLRDGGISRVAVYSNGSIAVPAGVDVAVAPGGSVSLSGRQIDVQGNIDAPAGSIKLVAVETVDSQHEFPNAADHGIGIGDGSRLSTRGLWSNDLVQMAGAGIGPVLPNGGTISLDSAADVLLGSGSLLDVSSGGWVRADNKLQAGNAGSITIKTGRFGLSGDEAAQTSKLVLGGELRGYALGKGGTLAIDTSLVRIGGAASGATNELLLGADFFRQGGFASYAVNGQDGLTLASGTAVTAQMATLLLDHGHAEQRSGADVFGFSHAEVALPQLRRAANVTLSANSRDHGDVVVEDGASVGVDAGGRINLTAGHQLTVLGTLQALAGSIALTTPVAGDKDSWDPAQSIWLGSGARLLAGGTARILPNAQGLRQGDILSGGSIAIDAGKGYVVTEAGSLMDVSGAHDTLDILQQQGSTTTYVPTDVASAAGSISIAAREGMLLNGSLRGAAAGHDASGGALSVQIGRPTSPLLLPNGPVSIVVSQRPQALPDGLAPGGAIADALNGKAFIAADAVRDGGFDDVTLRSQNVIAFDGNVDLAPRRSITLDAPNIVGLGDAAVRLGAAYAAIGTSAKNQPPSAASGGSGSFAVSAGLIDLQGDTALQGFGKVALASATDIRLKGLYDPITSTLHGSLSSGADSVTLHADQIYPATLSRYTLALDNNPAGVIAIESGAGGSPVLSAGGSVTVRAPVIEQGGVLKAPFGEIVLDAASSLTLAPGSVTSVSAEGQSIPFGKTDLSGRSWVYALSAAGDMLEQKTPPEKRISLSAPSLDIKSGATLDVSGGGDLYAYEFTKGPGGSKDVLDAAAGTFAILPALGAGTAPYDLQYYIGSDLKPGDSINLSGVAGLDAGKMYTLLPARYALLPGALLVTAVAGKQDMLPGQVVQNLDGTHVVSGYRAVLGADGALLARDARSSGFLVRPGSMARTQSGYSDTLGSNFFAATAAAQQPGDAGRLSIAATTAMVLGGTLQAGYADGSRGAEVDITAPKMAVVSDAASSVDAGFVKLDAATLNGWKAASLLLGGTRESTADGVVVHVGAEQMVLANDGASALAGPEIILAANDRVTLRANSAIRGEGAFSGQAKDIAIGTGTTDGNGALVRVSSGARVALTRGNADRSKGDLVVEQGALVSGNAIALDATRDNLSSGTIALGANGALDLASGRISLGDTAGVTEGLAFSNAKLAAFANLGSLTLRSYSTLDLYGDVAFGSSALGNLAVEAGGIVGYGGNSAVLTAQNVTLANPNGTAFSSAAGAPAPGSGKLSIAAQRVVLGAGAAAVAGKDPAAFEIRGFSGVNIDADKEIVGRGRGALNVANGDLAMTATRLTGENGARQTITAAGKLSYAQPVVLAGLDPVRGLGARFDLSAASVDIASRIDLPAGTLNLHATGPAATDGVNLSSGAWINAAGASRAFADTVAYAPAGSVSLASDKGSVNIDANAVVDVSGVAGGNAGTLAVSAVAGTAHIAGVLQGGSPSAAGGATPQQGTFDLDVGTLDDFSGLNAKLEAGGFTEARDLRVRSGDVTVDGTVTAHEFKLVADAGNILAAGRIDASGEKGGAISLLASGDVTLSGGASLDASATQFVTAAAGSAGDGGTVTLGTTGGHIDMQAGSSINVDHAPDAAGSGGVKVASKGEQGSVLLRLPRPGTGAGLAVASLAGSITGAREVALEAVKIYDNITSIGIATGAGKLKTATVDADNAAFMQTAPALLASLNRPDLALHLRPGVEIRSSGDLALDADWNLYSANRPGGEAGVLTLRAVGDLKLNKNLSDGFATATQFNPMAGPSWSYRLVAGADKGSADPLALLPPTSAGLAAGKGSVRVAAGTSAAPVRVRTGTGSIAIAAARDVVLGNQYSVIYTAGSPVVLPPDAIFPNLTLANFTSGGGDVTIRAGGDVKGAVSTQLVSEWLFRRGSLDAAGNIAGNTAWGINFRDFQQNVGALGGGDVTVLAGGNVENLSAAIPTNARLTGAIGSKPDAANLDINGGGDLTVRAGGDIKSGLFYVGQGHGSLAAGGSVVQSSSAKLHTILALGQGELAVSAGDALELETVLNPTVLKQASANGTANNAYFFTYGPDSAVSLTAVAGDLNLANDVAAITKAYPSNKGLETLLTAYPGTLRATALSGDVAVNSGFALFPAANGNLELLAGGGVSMLGTVNVSDVDPARFSSALVPLPVSTLKDLLNPLFDLARYHSDPLLHQRDAAPIRIVAASGSIEGNGNRSALFSKSAIVQAALDIRDFWVQGQNLRPSDTTSLSAGRDVVFDADANSNSRIQLDGPGRLVVAAGHNVDLGASYGIVTRGNVGNPYLPDAGASVSVLAGLGRGADGSARMPDYAGFAARYPDALGKSPAAVDQMFYDVLKQTGREAATAGGDHARGYDAIATLFPEKSYQGDVNLFFSQIKTLHGGDIDIMAPGGLVNAGLANPGAFSKPASDLGIVTVGGGSVHAFARNDFLVNQSRVFTLQGGDILIWSSLGNIDAGKGSRTASATPPPQLRVDANGQFVLDTTQSIAGSGIGVLLGNAGVKPGDVDLIAPVGTISAGDAGVRAAGNLFLDGVIVGDPGGFQAGGISVGVPVADAGGVGAGLTGASSLANPGNGADEATKSLAESGRESEQAMARMKQALADFKPSFLTVEVIGVGE